MIDNFDHNLECEVDEISEEAIGCEEDEARDECIDDDSLSFLRALFITCRSDVVVASPDEKEYRNRTSKQKCQ